MGGGAMQSAVLPSHDIAGEEQVTDSPFECGCTLASQKTSSPEHPRNRRMAQRKRSTFNEIQLLGSFNVDVRSRDRSQTPVVALIT
ncbi:hypothetical protein J6590_065679 [Homalodisca vitripennis]|nr:hypothetical protein J6590_065679 [Homalodisca vitripennis]